MQAQKNQTYGGDDVDYPQVDNDTGVYWTLESAAKELGLYTYGGLPATDAVRKRANRGVSVKWHDRKRNLVVLTEKSNPETENVIINRWSLEAAAKELGITKNAVRKRANRGTTVKWYDKVNGLVTIMGMGDPNPFGDFS